ncbi:MAG: DNRLRE domain-containing protein [Pseudomonadota bacterium]
MRALRLVMLSVLLLGGASFGVQATVLTFQEGDGGAFSETDASNFDNRGAAGSSFRGNNANLTTDTEVSGTLPTQYSMIGFFDIFGAAAGQIQLGSTIQSATLRVTQNVNTSQGTQSAHRVLRNWDESSVVNDLFFSGTNSRGDTEPLAGTDFDATVVDSTVPGSITNVEFDITSLVQAWSDGTDNFGLIIFNSGTDGWVFHSDNSATQSARPLLTVTLATPVPAPGTFGILMLGLLSVLKYRRA